MRNVIVRNNSASLTLTMIIVVSLILTTLHTSPTVSANPSTKISVVPARNVFNADVTPLNTTFAVNVTVTDVIDLWNWQVNFTFDPTLLQCTDAIIPPDSPFYFLISPPPVIDNAAGYVFAGSSQMGTYPGKNGTGVLLKITLNITTAPLVGSVSCNLTLVPPIGAARNTSLKNHLMEDIPATLEDGYYEYFRPVPSVEVRPQWYNATHLNESVTIDIWVCNVSTGYEFVGFQVILRFNTSLLEPTGYSAGTFMEGYANNGESLMYIESHDYIGDTALPEGYNAYVVAILMLPNTTDGNYYAPWPEGEGRLVSLHFNATYQAFAPEVAWTDLNFTYIENLAGIPDDNVLPYALTHSMSKLYFETLTGGSYRAPIMCNLTITTTTGGTTNPAPGVHSYPIGENVSVTATPDAGYYFSNWILDGANRTENPTYVLMDTNHVLQAVFGPTYNLTITTTTGGTTTPAPGVHQYPIGTNVSVTAIPNPGYNFSRWVLDGQNKTENPIYVLLDSNHVLQAVFVDETPPKIGTPTQNPPKENVQPNQAVRVSVNVTDVGTGVNNVTLSYRNDTTWYNFSMTLNATTGLWEATIPGFSLGTQVKYKITAYDNAGNMAVNDNATLYFSYTVIPEFSTTTILIIFLITTVILAISTATTKKSRKPANFPKNQL